MEGYYKLITKRLAQKGVISEIEADSIRPDIQVTGAARNSLAGETRSLALLPLRSNEIDINNKGIGYLLELLLFLSEEREEL